MRLRCVFFSGPSELPLLLERISSASYSERRATLGKPEQFRLNLGNFRKYRAY